MTHLFVAMIFDCDLPGVVRQYRRSANAQDMLHHGPVYTAISDRHPLLEPGLICRARLKHKPNRAGRCSKPARAGLKNP